MAIVSIIIPVYKVEPYIERCVQSVMAQTYTDIECILVDDCSPDQSIAICERMLIEYHGPITFQILHHEQNRGLSAARNTGTNAANSDYIFYLDSDDEITHDCISLLVKETERHPGVELVQGGIKAIPYDDFFNLSYYQQPGYYVGNDWIRFHFFKAGKEFPVMAWNKLILRDFLKKNHFVFKEGLIHEDELWMLQLAKKLDKIAIVREPTYFYYKTSNSIMSTLSKQHSAHHMLYISRVALQGLDEPYKMLQLFKYLWILVDRIEFGYKSKEGVKAVIASFVALIKCGYKRLSGRFIKNILYLYAHKGQVPQKIKDDIAHRWEVETQKTNNL